MTAQGEQQADEREGEGEEGHIAPHARDHAIGIAEGIAFGRVFARNQATQGQAQQGNQCPEHVGQGALGEIAHPPHQEGNGDVEVAPKKMEAAVLKMVAPTGVDNHGRDEFQTLSSGHGLFVLHGVVILVFSLWRVRAVCDRRGMHSRKQV